MPLLFIQYLLCFIWPLLLSFKLLCGTYRKNKLSMENNNEHIRFLLNYWICYCMLDYTIRLATSYFIFFLIINLEILCFFVKFWLFYGHGCLVVNFCYIDIFLRKISNIRNLETDALNAFELNFIDPLMRFILKRNYPASKILNSFSNSSNGVPSTIFIGMSEFQEFFHLSTDKSFLLFSLEHICRMDSWEDLIQNFETTNKTITSGQNLILNYLLPDFEDDLIFKLVRGYSVPSTKSEDEKNQKELIENESSSSVENVSEIYTNLSTYIPGLSFRKYSNRKNRMLKLSKGRKYKFKSQVI